MRKKYRKNSRKTYYFEGKDSPKDTWRRHVGPNKKIQMMETQKPSLPDDILE
ncbi:MAG: hypothetical protein NTY06_01280 [Candidatus Gottesmanbacteria bacterium]|nr:hypothetical protein [Candidatus Gottesmanbacteria bacterium]